MRQCAMGQNEISNLKVPKKKKKFCPRGPKSCQPFQEGFELAVNLTLKIDRCVRKEANIARIDRSHLERTRTCQHAHPHRQQCIHGRDRSHVQNFFTTATGSWNCGVQTVGGFEIDRRNERRIASQTHCIVPRTLLQKDLRLHETTCPGGHHQFLPTAARFRFQDQHTRFLPSSEKFDGHHRPASVPSIL